MKISEEKKYKITMTLTIATFVAMLSLLYFRLNTNRECVKGHYELRMEYDIMFKMTLLKNVYVCDSSVVIIKP